MDAYIQMGRHSASNALFSGLPVVAPRRLPNVGLNIACQELGDLQNNDLRNKVI
jgi:hypothetical protein